MLEPINGLSEIGFFKSIEAEKKPHEGHLPDDARSEVTGSLAERAEGQEPGQADKNLGVGESDNKKQEESEASSSNGLKNEQELTDEEKRKIQDLKRIDQEVRQHEMAHLSAAQGIALSGANFEYERGPDGVNYAVGGDVKIDTSKESDPAQTLEKARKIAAAANAPASPSPQDRSVAASAQAMAAEAQVDIAREKQTETSESQNIEKETDAIKAENQPGTIDKPKGTLARETPETGETKSVGAVSEASLGIDEPLHPGIQVYAQNQNFAPSAPLVPDFESPTTASLSFQQVQPPKPGEQLDLVA
jgi:SprA family protein